MHNIVTCEIDIYNIVEGKAATLANRMRRNSYI
jgi:hypothetical protein